MAEVLVGLNPAAIQRQIQALTADLLEADHLQEQRRPQTPRSGQTQTRIGP